MKKSIAEEQVRRLKALKAVLKRGLALSYLTKVDPVSDSLTGSIRDIEQEIKAITSERG
jgi:hypothetical protein